MTSSRRSWLVGLTVAAAAAFAAVAAFATAGEASQGAQAAVPPTNVTPPSITGTPERGQTLTSSTGTWAGTTPMTFAYQWLRCNEAGASCQNVGGAEGRQANYQLRTSDVGRTIRVRVTARNNDGTAQATSAQTAVVRQPAPPAAPCSGNAPIQIASVTPPERLVVDGQSISPNPVTRSTTSISLRFHVSCAGKSVQGALVYATAVPFNQFSIPAEATTGPDGWTSLTMNRQEGFPAARNQQLLVVFVRARKAGENVLGGVSTRRLVSFRVNLSG